MNRLFFVPILILLAFAAIPRAYAVSGHLTADPTTCTSIGGVAGPGTCTFSTLALGSGDTITIDSGIALIVTTLDNGGGTITNNGGYILDSGGTLNNNGVINDNSGIGGVIHVTGGTINNQGTINIGGSMELDNGAVLGTINNYGTINDAGLIDNQGNTVNNYATGTIHNLASGGFDNKGLVVNHGSLINDGFWKFGKVESATGHVVEFCGASISGTSAGTVLNVIPVPCIQIGSSANPSAVGQTVTFTATLTPATNLGGAVQFQIDGVNFGPAVTVTSGTVSSGGISTLSSGAHTVTATYTTAAPFTFTSTGTATQTVSPPTPEQAIHDLINTVNGMGLKHSLEHSLDKKLNAALAALNAGHCNSAENRLSSFLRQVQRHTGKDITQAQSTILTTAAQNIINSLGC